MCTVVYIPGENSKYFASLRDENPKRPRAKVPETYIENNIKYLAPVDALSYGTWIGINELGNVIILLNGGFDNHIREKYYRKSRGLIVSELLVSEVPVADWGIMDLTNIEPFTLITWNGEALFQLVWDGKNKQLEKADASIPHIWSSSTLYTSAAKAKREDLFQDWIGMALPVTKVSLLNFFNSSSDKENGYMVNRSEHLKTLSYSFIELHSNYTAVFNYHDLLDHTFSDAGLNVGKKSIAQLQI